jgi:hypothetical protein
MWKSNFSRKQKSVDWLAAEEDHKKKCYTFFKAWWKQVKQQRASIFLLCG